MQTADNHTVALSGALTFATARRLFNRAPQFNAPQFNGQLTRVDLTAVREIDGAGLALLVHWLTRAARAKTELRFVNPPMQLRKMAAISELQDWFKFD